MIHAVCVYGYSFAIFIVGAVVCIIPVNALRWVVMLACGVHSVCFMLTNFKRYPFFFGGGEIFLARWRNIKGTAKLRLWQ